MSVVWQGAVYVSLAEVRARYGLSRYALRKLIQTHGITRYRRLGENRLYVRQAELEAIR
jgi:hypothetical protein